MGYLIRIQPEFDPRPEVGYLIRIQPEFDPRPEVGYLIRIQPGFDPRPEVGYLIRIQPGFDPRPEVGYLIRIGMWIGLGVLTRTFVNVVRIQTRVQGYVWATPLIPSCSVQR